MNIGYQSLIISSFNGPCPKETVGYKVYFENGDDQEVVRTELEMARYSWIYDFW